MPQQSRKSQRPDTTNCGISEPPPGLQSGTFGTRKDYAYGALCGFLSGIIAIPALFGVGIDDKLTFVALPFFVAVACVFSVRIGVVLSRYATFFPQFGKFVAVGFLNTALDFAVLNILSMASGITSGFLVAGINIPGFAVASVNAYLWNKLWVFRDRRAGEGLFCDFPRLLAITFVGMLINSAIVYGMTAAIDPRLGLGEDVWLNIAKAFATVVALVWNFVGYKYLVLGARNTYDPARHSV